MYYSYKNNLFSILFYQIPYPIDKIVKVDRHIPVPINHYYHVDCPYEVIKYIEKPYIVKVERKVPVEIVKKVPVPQPVIQFESVIAKPQHINVDELEHTHHKHHHLHHHYHHHRKQKRHNPNPLIEIESLHISQAKPIHIYGNQPQSSHHTHHTHHQLSHYRRKRPENHNDQD